MTQNWPKSPEARQYSVNSQIQFLWKACPWVDESDGSKQPNYTISRGEIQGFLYKHRTLILKLLEVMSKDDFCRRLKIAPGSLQLFLDKLKTPNPGVIVNSDSDAPTPNDATLTTHSSAPTTGTVTPTDFASWLSQSIEQLEKERKSIESELETKRLRGKQLGLQISILKKARKDYLDRKEKIK